MQEGYSSSTQCSNYSKCSDCVKNFDGNSTSPCWWSNDKDIHGNVKGCSAFKDQGFSRTCTQPQPTPQPNTCNKATNCQSCLSSDCFWGDTEQNVALLLKRVMVKYVLEIIRILILAAPSATHVLN